MLPSYTALGMASLLPHSRWPIKTMADVLVDGHATASLEQRSAVLGAVNGVADPSRRTDGHEERRGPGVRERQRVVYIYHNTVDAIGDTASTEAQTFEAVRTAITDIAGAGGLYRQQPERQLRGHHR